MAECGIARCVQERRFFKKELQKWGKNVLFVSGLERVAEELVGHETWRQLMEPITEVESQVVSDWEPDDFCCFCHSRRHLPPDLAKGVCQMDGGGCNDATESESVLSEGVYYSSPLLPWYFPDGNRSPSPDEPLDLSMGSRSVPGATSPSNDNSDASTTVLKVPQIPLKPGMKKRFETSGCKRSYTENELQAALRDIQSGKLGTRRAAVIYGIPRSTLRNKVYKMASERESSNATTLAHSFNKERTTLSMEELVCANGSVDYTLTSASDSLRQLLRNRMAEKSAENSKKSVLEEEGGGKEDSATLQSAVDYSQALGPLLSQVLANVHELALSKLRSGSAITSALNATSPSRPSSPLQTPSSSTEEQSLPLLPDLIRRLVEERFEEERCSGSPSTENKKCKKDWNNASTANNVNNNNNNNPHNVILKIPSYKPMKSLSGQETTPNHSSASHTTSSGNNNNSNNSNNISSSSMSSSPPTAGKGIGASLREIIAKSISQRAAAANRRTATEKKLSPMAELLNGSSDSSNQEEPPSKVWKSSAVGKSRSGSNGSSNSNNATAAIAGHKAEKRTRPKRGRYRNYDRDNLAEAVRAVQRGEMSVHRAGSYYGVPHSTLEYKVKERHLLRPRKRDLKAALKDGGGVVDGKGAQPLHTHSNGLRASSVSPQSSDAPANKYSPYSSSSGTAGELGLSFPAHIPIWQSSPFFSLDFSQFSPNHFFASQMMRKLQEDALMHADGAGTGGNSGKDSVSLLSSIIRSGMTLGGRRADGQGKDAADKTRQSTTD